MEIIEKDRSRGQELTNIDGIANDQQLSLTTVIDNESVLQEYGIVIPRAMVE